MLVPFDIISDFEVVTQGNMQPIVEQVFATFRCYGLLNLHSLRELSAGL